MLEIIPAIDLKDGKAVRLRRGDFETAHSVADDPLTTAKMFADSGAPRLHIVDLDGAKTGTGQNAEIIEQIIRAIDIPVQVGGGLRSLDTVRTMLELGANRVIVGTSAAMDADFAVALLVAFGDKIIIGADTSNGLVAVRGWTETTTEPAADFGRRMVALGARRFLFTDVARDGMLTGNNADATQAFACATGALVIASGGVADVHDVERLATMQPDGIEGVIIGKALYAGTLTLKDALAAAESRK